MNASEPNASPGLGDALSWAIESAGDPALAAANWLVRDLCPLYADVFSLLDDSDVPLAVLRQAKAAFKTMRIVGETAADRRLGGRLYAAVIAVALVRFGNPISTQSPRAIRRALDSMEADPELRQSLRDAAPLARCVLARLEEDHRSPTPPPSGA